MALIFIDGADHYDDPQENIKWDAGDYLSIHTSGGRFNGGHFEFYSVAGSYRDKILPVQSTYYMGFAFISPLSPIYSTNYPLVSFRASNGQIHLKFTFDGSGYFRVLNGANSQLGISSNIVYKTNRWIYIEVMGTIHDSTGVIAARINEAEEINETGLDTKNDSGDNDIGKIRLRTGGVIETYFDDLYIDDSQFHGDCRVKTFMPDSDSATHTDFVRSGGSNDYECVDEGVPNDDTDYIYANVVGDKSTFGITTGSLGTVKGIQINNYLRKDDAGTRKIKSLIRSNGSDYNGAELADVPANYVFDNDIWELDPDDSAAWTQTKIEAAEFGLEITA